jgi:hypothetical protein
LNKKNKQTSIMLHECLTVSILEIMNSCSVNVSLVPSIQLGISLSLEFLAWNHHESKTLWVARA